METLVDMLSESNELFDLLNLENDQPMIKIMAEGLVSILEQLKSEGIVAALAELYNLLVFDEIFDKVRFFMH